MNSALEAIRQAVEQRLRGPRVSRLLERFGIEPRRYWLLMDLFSAISERGEMMDQLGRSGVALEFVAWIYFGFTALLSLLLVAGQPPLATYFLSLQGLSVFLLLTVLLSEAGNSLVNPVEGLVLAHQPINGATYTAAKLSHLLRIILYLVPGLNAGPALAGLALAGARWWYPFVHLAAALIAGLVAGLLCCALFGWLIRLLPERRVKAAGQLAGAIPFTCMIWLEQIRQFLAHLHPGRWLPPQAPLRWGLALCAAGAAVAAVALGIRSLSADYLLRVSGMVRGSGAAGSKVRQSRLGAIAARWFGGPPARGGFAFVSRMMLRDWQFRRQLVPMLVPLAAGVGGLLWEGWRIDPFTRRFTAMHVLPHMAGMLLFLVCNLLAYSSDYQGAWIFQLAPSPAIDRFAGGVFALLWMEGIVVPDLLLLPLLAWRWGIGHAVLFTAYSMAAASVYLGLELRLIEGAPFSKPVDPSRGAAMLPVAMAGGVAVAIAVGLQYFLLFRSEALVAAAAAACGALAFLAARRSIRAFGMAIRHNLDLASGAAAGIYREVGV